MRRDPENAGPPIDEDASIRELPLETLRLGRADHHRATAALGVDGTLQVPAPFERRFDDPSRSSSGLVRDRGETHVEENFQPRKTGIKRRDAGGSLRETT